MQSTTRLVLPLLFAAMALPAQDPQIQVGTHGQVRVSEQAGTLTAAWQPAGSTNWQELNEPDYRIMFRTGILNPGAGEPVAPHNLNAPAGNRLFLVQFHTQALEAYRTELRKVGGVGIFNWLPFQTYLVRMAPAKLTAVKALPFVRWAGPFHAGYKLEPELLTELAGGQAVPTRRYNVVLVDPDRDRPTLVKEIEAAGGKIDELFEGNLILEATLSGEQLVKVAGSSHVLWIDRWLPSSTDMDNARIQGGANYISTKVPGGFTGKGIRGEIYEGIYPQHPELAATSPHRQAPIAHFSGGNSHGHRTFSEIFAKGVVAQARGLLPDGQGIWAYNYASGARNVDRLIRELTDKNGNYRGMFLTASWGGSQTTVYTSTSATLDRAVFKYDVVRTNSQSNVGDRRSRPEAWGKNVIGGGGIYHYDNTNVNDDRWNRGASIGPAADGRIKPDLCAYYDRIYCAYSRSSTNHSYTSTFGGTSGATPIIAGYAGLTIEMFTDGLFGHVFQNTGWQYRFENKPHFTTTKALLINTARQYPFSGLSHDLTRVHQGWGFPHVGDMYDLRDKLLAMDEVDVVKNKEVVRYYVWVPAGEAQFRATMVYADVEGTANSSVHRVNDLDLWVKAADGKEYHGNYGLGGATNPSLAGNYSVAGGSRDARDTVENVFVQKPVSGIWTVRVTATEVNKDTHTETAAVDADFALVVSGLGAGRDRSGMTLDLASANAFDLRVTLKNLPAFAEGWTFFSFDTKRPVGHGHVVGVEVDGITLASVAQPLAAGNVFHFSSNKANVYPNTPYVFPAGVAFALTGLTIDAFAAVADSNGKLVAVSNVSRVKVP